MSYSILEMFEAARCEPLIQEVNAFIAAAYTEANVAARRAHVYEYGFDLEPFAFPVHCPGSPETDHLPGFRMEELPKTVADLSRKACVQLGITQGRVLFNISRYRENVSALPPHYDGELFDFTPDPKKGNTVRSAIRPTEVALLTLRNDTADCGTTLHDADGKVTKTFGQPGELLVFDNTVYQHGVPETGPHSQNLGPGSPPRWIRYTIGWRALEEGFYWADGEPLRPIRFAEAVELHEQFLQGGWAERLANDLSRATFPFPTDHV